MVGSEQLARAQYVSDTARRTVWVRQTSTGYWEAIDWYGHVIACEKDRHNLDMIVRERASNSLNNIYAVAYITEPSRRRPFKSKPIRRSL